MGVNPAEVDPLIEASDRAAVRAIRRAGRHAPRGQLGARIRAAARACGAVNPIGDGNGKTDSPGTYRPTGPSCPTSCPFLPMHRKQATTLDRAYLRTLARFVGYFAAQINWSSTDSPLGWTYCHGTAAETDELRAALPWFTVRHSDHAGPGGAVTVADWSDAPEGGVKCPAQLTKGTDYPATCRTCRACERLDLMDRPIVFIAEGPQKRTAAASVQGSKDGGCYSLTGNVAASSRRATVDPTAGALAAVAALVWAHETGRRVRLHVSGGFFRPVACST